MAVNMLGGALNLEVSDPFELAGRRTGVVVAVDRFADGTDAESLAVALDAHVHWRSVDYPMLVLRGRHSAGIIDQLTGGEKVICNAVGVRESAPDRTPSEHAEAWRGGLALIVSARR